MYVFLITLYTGLEHAFEADHLLAVSNLITNRKKIGIAVKDGVFWGIGHTVTLFIIGIVIILLKYQINDSVFRYFESFVGGVLIFLGIYRLQKLYFVKDKKNKTISKHTHNAAFGIGLLHGLAGSGALMLLVVSQVETSFQGMMYILIFGVGSIIGMFLASFLFGIPYSRKIIQSKGFRTVLTLFSCLLCIGYGAKVIVENLEMLV